MPTCPSRLLFRSSGGSLPARQVRQSHRQAGDRRVREGSLSTMCDCYLRLCSTCASWVAASAKPSACRATGCIRDVRPQDSSVRSGEGGFVDTVSKFTSFSPPGRTAGADCRPPQMGFPWTPLSDEAGPKAEVLWPRGRKGRGEPESTRSRGSRYRPTCDFPVRSPPALMRGSRAWSVGTYPVES